MPGGLTRVALKEGSLRGESLSGWRHQRHRFWSDSHAEQNCRQSVLVGALWRVRAGNTARLLDGTQRLSLLPIPPGEQENLWRQLFQSEAEINAFNKKYTDFVEDQVLAHMALDPDNSSSIRSCFIVRAIIPRRPTRSDNGNIVKHQSVMDGNSRY